ncbi:hypothetical protein [Coraliomargarita parva]|uniref:hypothetical protein n=1 Tax=Coraliomargarita parva TaxID=3014050 RepID=UPI0022B5616F|nr:hypothetical protein [Coraliomargarita parva]
MKLVFTVLLCSILSAIAGYVIGLKHKPEWPLPNKAVSDKPDTGTPEPLPDFDWNAEAPPAPVPTPDIEPEPAAKPDYAARAVLSIQKLTDKQGREIRATILSVKEGTVAIRREDGLSASFPLSLLSEEDADFCRYLEAQSQPEPTAEETIDWDAIFGD